MNNSVALLYNFNEEKLKMIKMVCMMMQVRFKEVARAEYEQPLGALLGISWNRKSRRSLSGRRISGMKCWCCMDLTAASYKNF